MTDPIITVAGQSGLQKAWEPCHGIVEDVILVFHHLVISSLNWPAGFQVKFCLTSSSCLERVTP